MLDTRLETRLLTPRLLFSFQSTNSEDPVSTVDLFLVLDLFSTKLGVYGGVCWVERVVVMFLLRPLLIGLASCMMSHLAHIEEQIKVKTVVIPGIFHRDLVTSKVDMVLVVYVTKEISNNAAFYLQARQTNDFLVPVLHFQQLIKQCFEILYK